MTMGDIKSRGPVTTQSGIATHRSSEHRQDHQPPTISGAAHLAEVPEIVLANEMLRRLPHAPDVQAGRPGTGLPLHNEVLVLPELSAEPTGGGRGSGY